MLGEETLYDLLGVSVDATTSEIVDAYRRLARRVHPDVGGTAALFRQIETAHSVLTNPARRAEYDLPVQSKPAPADRVRSDGPGRATGLHDAGGHAGAAAGPTVAAKGSTLPPGEVDWPIVPDRAEVLSVLRRWARTKRLVGNDTFDDIVAVEDATLCEVEIDRLVETRWEEHGSTAGQGVPFPSYSNLHHVAVTAPTTMYAEKTWSLAKQGSITVHDCRQPGGHDSCPECGATGYVTEFRRGRIQRKIVRTSLARPLTIPGAPVAEEAWRSFGPFSALRPPSGIATDLHREIGYELSKHPSGELLRELHGKLMPAIAVRYRKKRTEGLAFILGGDNEVRLAAAQPAASRS